MLGFVLDVCVLGVDFFRKLAIVSAQCVFRNTRVHTRGTSRVSARGNTMGEQGVGKCVPDIEVGKSTMVCDNRRAQLSGLAGWGYLS